MSTAHLVGYLGLAVGVPLFLSTTPMEIVHNFRERIWSRWPGKGVEFAAAEMDSITDRDLIRNERVRRVDLPTGERVYVTSRPFIVGSILSCPMCGAFWFGCAGVPLAVLLDHAAPELTDAIGLAGLPWAAYVVANMLRIGGE